MNYDTELAILIQQYRKEKFGWNTTIEEILSEPRYERVWDSWIALAHFKRSPYESFADVPDKTDGDYVTIMADVNTLYQRRDGEWVKVQEIRYEEMEGIYGDD